MRPVSQKVRALHAATGGSNVNYDDINVIEDKPTIQDIRNAGKRNGVDLTGFGDEDIQSIIDGTAAMSLPGGYIYLPKDARQTQDELDALEAHETEHQAQYQNIGPKQAFEQLIKEALMSDIDPYKTPEYLEFDAQQVENKANALLQDGWQQPNNIKNK